MGRSGDGSRDQDDVAGALSGELWWCTAERDSSTYRFIGTVVCGTERIAGPDAIRKSLKANIESSLVTTDRDKNLLHLHSNHVRSHPTPARATKSHVECTTCLCSS